MPTVERKRGEAVLVEVPGPDLAVREDAADGLEDLRPAAVVQGQDEGHPAVPRGRPLQPFDLRQGRPGDAVPVADDPEAEVVLVDRPAVLPQVLAEKAPEADDLLARPFPVLLGEGVEREVRDAQAGAGLGRLADGLGAGLVPLDPGEPPLSRPAPVAVHDDGDMAGKPGRVDGGGEPFLLAPGPEVTFQAFPHGRPLYHGGRPWGTREDMIN